MGTLNYLRQNELKALEEFTERLKRALKESLEEIWFFGSKARGDFEPDSDLDVLVILDRWDWKLVEQVSLTGARVSYEYDVLINTHSLSKERWEEMERFKATLWREIQRDGVLLMGDEGGKDDRGGEEAG